MPHLIKDPISAGAAILNSLHSIKSRFITSKANFVFTITSFSSGHTYNVFPDEAFMQGTLRTFDEEIKKLIKEKIVSISENTA